MPSNSKRKLHRNEKYAIITKRQKRKMVDQPGTRYRKP